MPSCNRRRQESSLAVKKGNSFKPPIASNKKNNSKQQSKAKAVNAKDRPTASATRSKSTPLKMTESTSKLSYLPQRTSNSSTATASSSKLIGPLVTQIPTSKLSNVQSKINKFNNDTSSNKTSAAATTAITDQLNIPPFKKQTTSSTSLKPIDIVLGSSATSSSSSLTLNAENLGKEIIIFYFIRSRGSF